MKHFRSSIGYKKSYEEASVKEREILEKYFLPRYGITAFTFTDATDWSAKHDLEFTHKGKNYIVELKTRNKTNFFYSSGYLEEDKFCYLTATTFSSTTIPVYVHYFTDHSFRIWNLKDPNIYTKLRWFEDETDRCPFENLGKQKKTAAYLCNSKGYLIKLNENKE